MKIAFLAAWAVFTAASAALRVFQLDRYVAGGLFTSQSLLQYGAIAGALYMKKIPGQWLRRIFGGFMVYAAIRLLLR